MSFRRNAVESKSNQLPSLADVLRRLNEGVDDFASKPAMTASDRGAFGDYPLHKVAIWGDITAASVLLDNGAAIDVQGEDDDTPLHRAIAGKQLAMVAFLLSHGADADIVNRYGRSAREEANDSGSPDLIAAMNRGALS
jgi:ankyrin repeat protein